VPKIGTTALKKSLDQDRSFAADFGSKKKHFAGLLRDAELAQSVDVRDSGNENER